MKILSCKDIEEALRKSKLFEYPKYIGNGLWRLSENYITNLNEIKNDTERKECNQSSD